MDENKKTDVESSLTRRSFIKTAASIAAGAAVGSVLPMKGWAAPLVKNVQIKLRQDLVPDALMNSLLHGFAAKNKGFLAKSSYINSDRGWDYEVQTADIAPPWYTDGEPCDLFLARGPALAQLADAGTIMPLDGFLAASEELSREDFHRGRYGGVLDAATYKEKLWGIPISGNTYALFCNLKLFEDAGLGAPPDTWEQAVDYARRMTRDTNGDGKPDVFGYSQCSFQFPLQIIGTGLGFVDLKNRRSTFDTPEALEALDIYRRLIAYSPDHVDFEKGDMGMKISVTTNAFGRYSKIRYITAPLPAGRRRANTYGDSDGIVALAVSAKADKDRQFAAWKLIEYLSGRQIFFKLSDIDRSLPLRNSIRNSERYQSFIIKNPQMKAFMDEMEYAVPKPCIPEYRFIETVMREILYPVQVDDPMSVSLDAMREHLKRQAERVNLKLQK